MKILKALAPLIVLVIGIGVSFAIINSKEQPASQEVETKPRNIRAVIAEKETVQLKVQTQGSVQARQVINIVPQVSGNIVYVSDKFVAGGKFEKDEIILKIDPRDYEAAVISAQSTVAEGAQRLVEEKAEAELALSEWQELGQGEASDLTLRKPQLARAEAQLQASQANLQMADLNLERTVIRAPFNGLLTSKNADLGQFLSPGGPIGTFHSTDVREIRLPLSPMDRTKIDLNGLNNNGKKIEVTFTVTNGEFKDTWNGQIVRTEGLIVNNTDILWVVAELSGDQLKSKENGAIIDIGQFVDAEITGRSVDDMIVLPRGALNQGNTVMIVDNQNSIRTQKVSLIDSNSEFIVVTNGLEGGETVNITQLGASVDGMLVLPAIVEGVN